MSLIRIFGLCLSLFFLAIAIWPASPASAGSGITVAYAGSMGAVMEDGMGPAFSKADGLEYHGIGQGSYGLAQLLKARQRVADVFVPITPGPVKLLQKAGLVDGAKPVASTRMVIVYSPKSRFAADFKAAANGDEPWYGVLEKKGVRFGRTDPATDPKGRNIIFTMQLAERYYKQPGLVDDILGSVQNPAQIFSETALLSRLDSGQIDAAASYEAEARSRGLPFIELPDEINLSNPAMNDKWYSQARFTIPGSDGKPEEQTVQPLVYYAAIPNNAPDKTAAKAFVAFMLSDAGQKIFHKYGYDEPKGDAL